MIWSIRDAFEGRYDADRDRWVFPTGGLAVPHDESVEIVSGVVRPIKVLLCMKFYVM